MDSEEDMPPPSVAHEGLFQAARETGRKAAEGVPPTDETGPEEGGHVSVVIRDRLSRFARWVMQHRNGHKGYRGGVEVWITAHGRNYEKKVADANAMAKFLIRNGVDSYVESRPYHYCPDCRKEVPYKARECHRCGRRFYIEDAAQESAG